MERAKSFPALPINSTGRQTGRLRVPHGVAIVATASSGSHINDTTRTLDVFHVAEAKGSPFLPAQEEFVIP
ncbi:MAG: hypothetical protein ABI955_05025 [Nitrospirota bacterium]